MDRKRTMCHFIPGLLCYSGGAWALFNLLVILYDHIFPRGAHYYYVITDLWVAARYLPAGIWLLILTAANLVLLWHALVPIRPKAIRLASGMLIGLIALAALVNMLQFYKLLARGTIQSPAVLPTSLFVTLFLAALSVQIVRNSSVRHRWTRLHIATFCLLFVAVVLAFPLLLCFTYGPTDYTLRADCAVVFGAAVRPGQVPSLALADRVDEGIRLYKNGKVDLLIMSGGGEPTSPYSEPLVMRDRAIAAGVPADKILMDPQGNNSAATVRNTATIMREQNLKTVLAVSHYYHLPRIKMLFDRAGVRHYTVPAMMTRRMPREPYFIAREVAAFYNSFFLQRVTPQKTNPPES
jgi:uncharacterized SAM-binding protein YcdF (DUF218 family)